MSEAALMIDCPKCHGASTVDPDPDCTRCEGEGEVPWPRGHRMGFGLLDDGSYRFWLPRRVVLARWPFRGKKWRADRKRLARLRAFYWIMVRDYESELCERCGGPVGVVFHVPDWIWELATGYARFPDGQAAPGCLCIKCVDDVVDPKIDTYLRWTCSTSDEAMHG